MKNMKISGKLLLSFVIVIVLSLIIGIFGIVGMVTINNSGTEMYEKQAQPIPYLSKVVETLQRMRVNMREYAIGAAVNDQNQVDSAYAAIEDYKSTMKENLDNYSKAITSPEARKLFDQARALYETSYMTSMQRCYDLAKAGDITGIVAELAATRQDIETIVNNFDQCMDIKVQNAGTASAEGDAMATALLIAIIAILMISASVSFFLAAYISKLIGKPVNYMKEVISRIGEKGDMDFSAADYAQTEEYAKVKDEVGQSVGMLLILIRHLVEVGGVMESIANGDLTKDIDLLSKRDTMGLSLRKMVDNLNHMFSEINTASYQVSTGSKQVADGSQSLAQGSTEQAAAVEQLSASISEIADKTRHNAEMAKEAATLSETIRGNAEKGSTQMEQMMQAVKEINDAGQNISKVIDTIDNIAFQTNILALNAAVEAARAGQHGKGFAVVAEEVRALATKSADAARETGGMIANSIEKATTGNKIAIETSESLKEIVGGINRSTEIVTKIASSSEEQAMAISQINKGIDQVAQVVQQNSATAEQSAAASEEMSGQSSLLQELVSQFKLKDQGPGSRSLSPKTGAKRPQLNMPPKSGAYEDGFGKY